jgi:hypothetical protein
VIAGKTAVEELIFHPSAEFQPYRPSHTLFIRIQQVTSLLKLWLDQVKQTASPPRLAENQA